MPTNKTWNSSDLRKGTHTVLSLYSPFLFLIKFYFFFFSGTPSITVPHNCVIISRVLPWVIMFDHCEDIMNRVL